MEGHLEEIEKQMGQLALAVKAARESDRLRESARARQDTEVKELAVGAATVKIGFLRLR